MRDGHMIEPEELEGIVGALGAATHEEVINVVKELAYERDEDEPLHEEIEKMCEKAVLEHLLETITSEELIEECDKSEEDVEFYILGPNAFPEYPFELSEVLDTIQHINRTHSVLSLHLVQFSLGLKHMNMYLRIVCDSLFFYFDQEFL